MNLPKFYIHQCVTDILISKYTFNINKLMTKEMIRKSQ